MTKIHCDGYKGWWEICPASTTATAMPDLSTAALIVGVIVAAVFVALFMQMIVWSTE